MQNPGEVGPYVKKRFTHDVSSKNKFVEEYQSLYPAATITTKLYKLGKNTKQYEVTISGISTEQQLEILQRLEGGTPIPFNLEPESNTSNPNSNLRQLSIFTADKIQPHTSDVITALNNNSAYK